MSDLHMMDEILRQAQMEYTISEVEKTVIPCCKTVKETKKNKRIIITGSGDSYYIGVSVKPFFEKVCPNSQIEVIRSMEFAKYNLHKADAFTTVIAVSMSGNVMRTIECVKESQKQGAFVIGITNNNDSRLAEVSERPIYLALNTEPTWTCGTLTYTGSLYALYRIAIELSEKTPEEKARLLKELADTMSKIGAVIELSDSICKAAARNMRIIGNKPPHYILGAGPNLGTAKYGAAKFYEICSTLAIAQECEEFCHCEFWMVDRANLVFFAAPTGAGFQRCVEVSTALRTFGCDLFMVSDDAQLCEIGKFSIRMPHCDELFSPLLYSIPFQLVAYYYSYEKGLNPDTRDHTDPFRKQCSRLLTRGVVTEL